MDEVESIFTRHFASNDRKKAMKFLRPQQHKDSHMVTFFVGTTISGLLFPFPSILCLSTFLDLKYFLFCCMNAGLFTGCFVTLFSVYAILAHLAGLFSPGTEAGYVETVYPVFRYFNFFIFIFGIF